MDGKAPETKCPQCGLVIKLTNQSVDACPVCGAKLPVAPAGKKSTPERKGPIMLEQALFKSPRAKESWAPRELTSAIMLTFFVVMMVNYVIVASGAATIESGQFDPILYFSINLASVLVGVAPILYILISKTSVKKLALKGISQPQWLQAVGLGIAFGFGLYAVYYLGQIINVATGLESIVATPAENQYSAFMSNIGNRLFMLVPLAAGQVVGEFFYRGTVLNGVLQWLQKRVPPLPATARKLRAWALSFLIGTLFDFAIFFNPTTIFPSLLAHALIGLLFVYTGNLQAGMIAQSTYMLLAIAIV